MKSLLINTVLMIPFLLLTTDTPLLSYDLYDNDYPTSQSDTFQEKNLDEKAHQLEKQTGIYLQDEPYEIRILKMEYLATQSNVSLLLKEIKLNISHGTTTENSSQ